MLKQVLIGTLLLLAPAARSQKYNFVNWTVEDGLIQSQASVICQDAYRQLWIGTEGGISRFDGKKFQSYTVQDGLISNRITALMCDQRGTLWIGSNKGLTAYNGRSVNSISTGSSANNLVQVIALVNDHIYALTNNKLYLVENLKSRNVVISGDSNEIISSIYHTNSDQLLAAVKKKGIYVLKDGQWKKLNVRAAKVRDLNIRKFFISTSNDTFLITTGGLYCLKCGQVEIYTYGGKNIPLTTILCMAEDQNKTLWLGTDKGAYKLEAGQILHVDEKKGFSDNSVQFIFRDVENNLWFGTSGDGIYKFRENTFTYYDKASGLSSSIVMGIAQTRDGKIYAGGYGGGLYEVDRLSGLKDLSHTGLSMKESKINCLYADRENNLLIGTLYEGAWKFNPKKGLAKIGGKNAAASGPGGVICFLQDQQANLLIGSQQGLFILDKNDSIKPVQISAGQVTTLKQFGKDSILIGTSKGLFLLDNTYKARPYLENEFGNTSVLCVAINRNNIWIGTTDEGVMNWDRSRKRMLRYNTSNGLPSNFIYSIDISDENRAWIGTGFGICNLQLSEEGKVLAIKNYGRSDGLLGMECNHNSLLRARDSSLWFGTTKGLFHFNPYANTNEINRPSILLRSVKLFSSPIVDSAIYRDSETWFNVPHGLSLNSKQNHLTFELGAIYFTNPDDVNFRYKLEGIDKDYTTTGNPLITYPSLPPGKYVLKAMGITKSGILSVNEITYSFVIKKAFYQTRFFQGLIIILLIGLGALFAFMITRGRQKRKQREKEITEKIREEEFNKLRQRTAEDFHDEMGNNLTRIAVLTDILKSKLSGNTPDLNKLLQQIKENTSALYSGSRDIIWSLHSRNDGLFEIIEHIKDIGRELFQDTGVEFTCSHTIPAQSTLKLKLDHSRNLTMIFKEAFNNILKHSGATLVSVFIEIGPSNELIVNIQDNGKGFEIESSDVGNGLNNMKNRTQRMDGIFKVNSEKNKGTEIRISLTNIFVL